jgi:hypothetical protein
MRRIIIFTVFAFLLFSCITDDPDTMEQSDGEFDYGTDNDEDNLSQNDEEVKVPDTDGSNEMDSDNNNDESGKEDPDEEQPKDEALCGNGIIEKGEICDKNKVPCYELGPEYTGGEAACKDDCLGWNTQHCFGPDPVSPVASITSKTFTLEYLYNGVDAFKYGANQDNELWSSALFSTSIPLTTGTYYIPHNVADAHWLAGFYDAQTVQFVQQSFVLSSGAFTLPYVVLGVLKSAAIKDAVLSIGIKDSNEVNFVVFDMVNNQDCVILVGYGTLTVNAINIAQGHAGLFQFSTSKIDLFLPVETPEGNVISDVQSAGFTVCQ